ncbi:MAG: WD40 repeat domain-containing protein [Armatimonadota bacterium]
MTVWGTRDWQPLQRLPKVFAVGGFTQDGKQLLTSDARGGTQLWDGLSFRSSRTVTPASEPEDESAFSTPSNSISPDGQRIATGCSSFSAYPDLTLWSTATGKPVVRRPFIDRVLRFSPNSALLACEMQDIGIVILDAATARQVHVIHSNWLVFTPDGKAAISEDRDGIAYWNTRTWKIERRLTPRGGGAFEAAISGDGQILAIATDSGVRLLDAGSGLELMVITGSDSREQLTFSPDGTMLAITRDRQVEIWQVPPRWQLLLRAILRGPDR